MASPDPTFLELLEPIVFVEDQATSPVRSAVALLQAAESLLR